MWRKIQHGTKLNLPVTFWETRCRTRITAGIINFLIVEQTCLDYLKGYQKEKCYRQLKNLVGLENASDKFLGKVEQKGTRTESRVWGLLWQSGRERLSLIGRVKRSAHKAEPLGLDSRCDYTASLSSALDLANSPPQMLWLSYRSLHGGTELAVVLFGSFLVGVSSAQAALRLYHPQLILKSACWLTLKT